MAISNSAAGVTYDASGWLTNYGSFAYGPNIIVIHSLECDAVDHIAEQLSAPGGWLDNEGLAPQRMTDPCSIVKTMPDGDQGGHIGGPGNSHCAGVEVTGRAAWTAAQWAAAKARAAVDHQARAVAGLAIAYGWARSDLRWLSIAQIKAGSPRGLCSHNDISISGISGTNHWDPGLGYDWAYCLTRAHFWFDTMTGNPPDPPKDWFDMATAGDLDAAVAKGIKALVPPLVKAGVEERLAFWFPRALAVLTTGAGNAAFSPATTPAVDGAGAHGSRDTGRTARTEGQIRGNAAIVQGKAVLAAVNTAANADAALAVVIDTTTGAWYAVGPGTFWHLPSPAFVAAGRTAGLLASGEQRVDAAGIVQVRAIALGGAQDVWVPPVRPTAYTMLHGDTLTVVAAKFGLTLAQLLAANKSITNPDVVADGTVLVIPPKP